MERDALLRQVSERLGDRRVVWSGLRGEDVEPLVDLPQLYASYSMISSYSRRESIEALAHEDLTGVRPDLELYDIDDHLDEDGAKIFRQAHLRALAEPSALIPYRASPFLSSIWFARRDRCLHLGMFGGLEAAFEHKPWVETSLQTLGIETVPWVYVADEDQLTLVARVHDGPLVLRRSRTSGGEGFHILEDPTRIADAWPNVSERFVSVAPYLVDALPLNVAGTVWHDGVTVHLPSVQLVGIPDCVSRPFGYCGNDFGAVAALPASLIDELEVITTAIGRWLGGNGYIGSFGLDFLVHEGRLLFTEINPRFQGSTHASCRLSIEAGQSCLMLEHVAAFLGIDAPTERPLRERLVDLQPMAHLVVHWTGERPSKLDTGGLARIASAHVPRATIEVRPPAHVSVEPGAVAARLVLRDQITETGFDLRSPWPELVHSWVRSTSRTTHDDGAEAQ